jgi:hypothetical protein
LWDGHRSNPHESETANYGERSVRQDLTGNFSKNYTFESTLFTNLSKILPWDFDAEFFVSADRIENEI